MAEEKPENTGGKAGSGEGRGGDEGQGAPRGNRSGRHKGNKGRRCPRDAQAQRPADAQAQRRSEDSRPDAARPEPLRQETQRDMPLCPLCGKPVYDLSTALASSREAAEPAHFDCVIERVTASETLAAGEKVVYLGSGAFGVVVSKEKSDSAFTVVRRIQWEKEGEKKDWRKTLSSRISNL